MGQSRLEFARSRLSLKKRESCYSLQIFHDWVTFGDNCEFNTGCVIGHSGFGFEPDKNGAPIEIVHTGGVVIGDNVRIGANTIISRGTIENTIIEDNVKIDDLVHVAHNCRIGKNTMIASGTIIGGSCDVGENVWIGSHSVIKNKVKIGDRAFVGVGAVVVRDVPPGIVVFGNPARMLRERRPDE